MVFFLGFATTIKFLIYCSFDQIIKVPLKTKRRRRYDHIVYADCCIEILNILVYIVIFAVFVNFTT